MFDENPVKIEYGNVAQYNQEDVYIRAMFSDESENFVYPAEPEKGDSVNIRFRSAAEGTDAVYLCCDYGEIAMDISSSDDFYNYYSTDVELSDCPFMYCFKIISGDRYFYYDKTGVKLPGEDIIRFRIIPGFKTPDWAKGAVMYQIYTDRFYNGDKSNDVETDEYSYIGKHVVKSDDWYKYPDPMDVRTFYGGDLKGVIDKFEYLSKLGVQVIYLNPLFVSPSNHKYDTQDYEYIDPHIGIIVNDGDGVLVSGDQCNEHASKYIKRVTDKENLEASNKFFSDFVKKAHEHGLKVIIDGVFNHCGSFNKWLDREKIYNTEGCNAGAYRTGESEYRDFFAFGNDSWPDNNSYEGWWNHETLPKLNYEGSDKLEEYILNIGKKWVSPPYNADGWRLDVAADLGHSAEYNHSFWAKFRKAVKEANPEAIILAEHYGDAGPWLTGDQWDTVMNYDAFMEPVTWFLTGMEKHSDGKNEELKGDAGRLAVALKLYMSRFSWPSLITAMNQLSNHDHSRFLTRTNGKIGRTGTLGPEAANEGIRKAVMKEAVVMQMTMPGAPTIYYGDEAGLCGWTDPDNRRGYPWGREDLELLEFHRDVIRIHRENAVLQRGSFKMLYGARNIISYGRFDEDNKAVVIINNNESPVELEIGVWEIGILNDCEMERILLTNEECYNVGKLPVKVEKGMLRVHVPPTSAAIYRKAD